MKAALDIKGLELESITEQDIPCVAAMLAKEKVCRYLFFGPNTEEETDSYFSHLLVSGLADNVFAIRIGGRFAGYCGLLPVEYSPGNYEVGYILDDMFWGRGLGNAVCRFMVGYGFGELGASRLSAGCFGDNAASRRILEGCGFKQEGLRRNFWIKNGVAHDEMLFGLLREDFRTL